MKISIITIVYNDAGHIRQTIESVIRQTAFSDIEYIVVDGASTDGTSEIIREYDDKISRYIRESDTGIYNAMNKGLASATGEYVMFCNSGDSLSSESVIETIIEGLKIQLPKVAYGTYREVRNGKKGNSIPCRKPKWIWWGMVASHQSTIYSLPHLRKNGIIYDESYRIAADYCFTAQAILTAKGEVLPMDVCVSDFDTDGISSTNQDLGLKEASRVRREIMGWSHTGTKALELLLLCARYAKRYANPIYRFIRN